MFPAPIRKRLPPVASGAASPNKRRHISDAPMALTWASAPQEGPILLSTDQVANLGTYIDRDVRLLREKGWDQFVQERRGLSDINVRANTLRHLAAPLLKHLRQQGAQAPMTTAPWSDKRLAATIARGPHKSAFNHVDFLGQELMEFILKGQWVVLPYSVVSHLPE
jgi:hypothetical protein